MSVTKILDQDSRITMNIIMIIMVIMNIIMVIMNIIMIITNDIRIIRKNCEYNEEYFDSVARAASAESTMS